ncbi:hypothetical protein [Algibacter sp. R77976]|uniref:hypothetical protein n=1 Tax=Algibacter sp. R77976 TaxID=3093873 RepID=UPI0037CB9D08
MGINITKHFFLVVLLAFISNGFAQKNFAPNTKIYIKGHSALIGNNILSTHSEKPVDDAAVNDFNELKFIDVDDDPNTFSSSQANLNSLEADAEIEYAALYWSAIYKYDKGWKKLFKFKRKGQLYKKYVYEGSENRFMDVNTVLFKTPNGKYNTLNGQIIFDDFNNEAAYPDTKPYVCYADVTSLLKNNTQVNGTYTVANIKATEGYVAGGAAGGWLLYVVYKTDTATPKYFTTYNGFLDVFKKPVNIHFNDFKAPEDGNIETSLLIGVLEGDQKFKSDKCSFLNYQTNTFIPLFNKLRPKLNFFNSTISIDDALFTDRNPNSKNTFGFDALKIKLPNENNSVISHNVSEATIQFNSKADQFYLFFVAFETEISPIYEALKKDENSILMVNGSDNDVIDEGLEKIKNLKSISIPTIEKGYYLVTNIFSKKGNAKNWTTFLKGKGYTPKAFVNPENGWTYVYLKTDPDPNVIYQKQKDLLKLDDFKDIWVLRINI